MHYLHKETCLSSMGVVNHKYHYPQRRGILPPLHPIIAQLPILAAEVPLSPDTISQHICQGNEVSPVVLNPSEKQGHLC